MTLVKLQNTVAALGLCLAAPVLQAQTEWSAIAIGQPGSGAPTAFADAFHVTASLSRGGDRLVQMLRDTTRDDVIASLRSMRAGHGIIVYIAGPVTADGALALGDDVLTLSEIQAELAGSGIRQIAFLLETCAHADATPSVFALPDADADTAILLAASASANATCPPAGSRLTDRIQRARPNAALQQILAGQVISDGGLPGIPLTPVGLAQSGPVIAASPISGGGDDVVIITPVAPTTPLQVSAAPAGLASGAATAVQAGGIVQTAAFAGSGRGILPRAPGMPEPSILIGFPDPADLPTFDSAQDTPPAAASELALDDPDVRTALRSSDPDLFSTLLLAGAFDPPAGEVAVALQIELERFDCYTAAIDGVWGPGSRGAVERFFDKQPGITPVSLQPDLDLFRQIVSLNGVDCDPPAVVVRPAAPARQVQPQPPASAAATAAPPAPAPAPAPPAETRAPATALGVFR